MSSALGLLLNLGAVGVYGYSIYYMNFDSNFLKIHTLIPAELRVFGMLKFLTYQCLLIQFVSSLLHVGAFFSRALVKPRDFVFTTLAYPVGSVVVYTFWAVWHLMGREFILPAEMSRYYPDWLNHSTHSIIAPINLLLVLLVNHKYSSGGYLFTIFYTGCYTIFLHYIKSITGLFVYKYLETMSEAERIVYFAGTGVLAFIMYLSGQLLTSIFHGAAQQRPALKKQKNKQK